MSTVHNSKNYHNKFGKRISINLGQVVEEESAGQSSLQVKRKTSKRDVNILKEKQHSTAFDIARKLIKQENEKTDERRQIKIDC